MLRSYFSWIEARRFFHLGVPVFIAQITQVGMNFVDTAMCGQYGAEDMAAVAVAGSIWAPLSVLSIGILLALVPLMAQAVGGGRRRDSAHLLRQGLILMAVLSLVFMLVLYVISWNLESFGLQPRLATLAGGYLRAILWGLPGFLFFITQRCFLEGYSRTQPAMVIGIFGLILNVPCNYILIYGQLGLPALGAVGCGWATTLCYWFMGLAMFYYVRRDPQYRDLCPLYAPLWGKPAHDAQGRAYARVDRPLILRVLRIGSPNALAMFFEVSLFALSALLLAPLGTIAVAGHQIAANFSTLLFMFPLSLGITTTIRVGHCLGAGRVTKAKVAARTGLCISIFQAVALATGIVLFNDYIVRIYSNDAVVTTLAASLLIYTACYQLVDGLQTVGISILRGHNDTRIIGMICFVAYWIIGIPVGFVLSRTDYLVPALGPAGFWTAYIMALGFGACCYLWRVYFLHSLPDADILARVHR